MTQHLVGTLRSKLETDGIDIVADDESRKVGIRIYRGNSIHPTSMNLSADHAAAMGQWLIDAAKLVR